MLKLYKSQNKILENFHEEWQPDFVTPAEKFLVMERNLKIQPKIVKSLEKPGYKIFPEIKLAGNWLAEAGFPAYSLVNIHVENGKLTITPTSK